MSNYLYLTLICDDNAENVGNTVETHVARLVSQFTMPSQHSSGSSDCQCQSASAGLLLYLHAAGVAKRGVLSRPSSLVHRANRRTVATVTLVLSEKKLKQRFFLVRPTCCTLYAFLR